MGGRPLPLSPLSLLFCLTELAEAFDEGCKADLHAGNVGEGGRLWEGREKKGSKGSTAAPAAPPSFSVDAKQGGGKLKTKKAASKRIKVTAGGKVMVRKAGKQHINEKMSSAKLSALSKEQGVPDCNLNLVIKCMPYAGIKH